MTGKRKKSPASNSAAPAPFGEPSRSWLRSAPAALAALWPALLVVGGYLAWHQWGADRLGDAYGRLEASQLQATPAPDFIRVDVVAHVFRDTDLQSVSLLDRGATAQIAHAFATHPWVANVDRVQKRPDGSVEVTVRYRRPVAMVKVESRHPEVDGPAFYAVDGEAVLLPQDDFSPADTLRYVHIDIPGAYPASGVGTPFGDTRVEAAAALARVLAEVRETLGVREIQLADPDARADQPLVLVLRREGGERVVWGSPPGEETGGEAPAAVKLQRLAASARGTEPIDLRVAMRPREGQRESVPDEPQGGGAPAGQGL